jgi:hypothetical protein
MRVATVLVVLFVLFSGWQILRREQTERGLALVAGEVAQREVDVSCPGFWARLVEITPNAGWVGFDEHGRPDDTTKLSAKTCSSLDRLRRQGPPEVGCLLERRLVCPGSTLEVVEGLVVLAHESCGTCAACSTRRRRSATPCRRWERWRGASASRRAVPSSWPPTSP